MRGFVNLLNIINAVDASNGAFVRKDFVDDVGRKCILFDYVYAYPALFDGNPELLECRGITFDRETGEILSRPYHKFFNAGEIPGTSLAEIDLSAPHVIMEKLDGSMIRTLTITKDVLRLGTRMGMTDIATQAEQFIADKPEYARFIRDTYDEGYTAIFEWCSRQNRVVLDHPVDRLVLTALRHRSTGDYMVYDDMTYLATRHGVEVVKVFKLNTGDREAFAAYVRDLKNAEGFVIRFDEGRMLKVKADEYVARHRAMGLLQSERTMFETILNGMFDDALVKFNEDDQERARDFCAQFYEAVESMAAECSEILRGNYADRKDFALRIAAVHPAKAVLFAHYGSKDTNTAESLFKVLCKQGTCNDPDKIRAILRRPDLRWNPKKWNGNQ